MSAVDIGLDPGTDDLPDEPIEIYGLDLVLQTCDSIMRFHEGEWFVDERVGLPFVDWLTDKDPNLRAILSAVEQEIRTVDHVTQTVNATIEMVGSQIQIGMDIVLDSESAPISWAYTVGTP